MRLPFANASFTIAQSCNRSPVVRLGYKSAYSFLPFVPPRMRVLAWARVFYPAPVGTTPTTT
jgi:hypothetical protein